MKSERPMILLSIPKVIFKYTYSYTNQQFLFILLALILMFPLNFKDYMGV